MEDINNIQKELIQSHFEFFEKQVWKSLPYIWADYFYRSENDVLAKYLFISADQEGWSVLHRGYEQFVSDVIEPAYYSLDSDLRWNLYIICVVDDDEIIKIDRYEKRNFENNVIYTRNFLIPMSQIKKRIPIGRVSRETIADKILYPIEEWQKALEEYPLCLQEFSEKVLDDYVGGKSQTPHKSFFIQEAVERIHISSLQKISIPVNFRPHFYQKDWSLPCGKFNLLLGANGTGKTSVLSGIELAITGKIFKPSKYIERGIEQSDITIEAEGSDGQFQLERPQDKQQRAEREAKWYNFDSDLSMGRQLNSLFHRFNYFSVEDPYRFISDSLEMDQLFSKLLFGVETLKIWNNIREYLRFCRQKQKEMAEKCESLKIRMMQAPPKVETIFEDTIRRTLKNLICRYLRRRLSMKSQRFSQKY